MNFFKKIKSFFLRKKKKKIKKTKKKTGFLRNNRKKSAKKTRSLRSKKAKSTKNTTASVTIEVEPITNIDLSETIVSKPTTTTQSPVVKRQEQVNNEKLSSIKVVITGSVGAGKTTSIIAVSEKAPITTETAPSDEVKAMKSSTTITMDYGSYIHQGRKIHIYGTPGQQRFGFMSEVLTKGAYGLIILISHNQKDPLEELNYYLQNNKKFLSTNPGLIGVTHLDVSDKHDISTYTDYMEEIGVKWPVRAVDARKKSDMQGLIEQLIEAV